MSMSELEKEKIKDVARAYSDEEIKIVLSTFPSQLLFEELIARDKRNNETLARVATLVSH